MLSEKQRLEKLDKVKYFVDLFLNSKKTIGEISIDTHTPKSSIQRYLNDEEYIREIYGIESTKIILEVQRKLLLNKEEGNKKGGIVYYVNNTALKDLSGHFIGSKRR